MSITSMPTQYLSDSLKGENVQRILLIRSAQMGVVHAAISSLVETFPSVSLEVLCQPDSVSDLQSISQVDKLFLYDKNFFDLGLMEEQQLEELIERKYDLVVVVYSNASGDGYAEVERLGAHLCPRYLFCYNSAQLWCPAKATRSFRRRHSETASDNSLARFENLHVGKRAFIIGMGPSLLVSDLERLKGEVTFACNKIYLAFNETDWRPNYYSVIDLLVAQNNHAEICNLQLEKIFTHPLQSQFQDQDDISYVKAVRNPGNADNPDVQFGKDILRGTYGGHTVIYFQLQLAYYMGIREVYLLGVDFSFDIPASEGEKTDHGEDVLIHSGERNHFHPDYRKAGEKWSMPNMDYQYKAFLCAKEVFEAGGGFIANASRKTKLDVFFRVNFEQTVK